MFRLDTGQARTDLYGINKGAAQVIDLSPLREQAAQERKENFAQAQLDKKEGENRVSDIATEVSGLNKLAVLDRERPMFAELQSDLYKDVKNNIEKIRSGDTNALLEIKQKLGDIYTKAELSKNTREQLEKYSAAMLNKGFDKYNQKSVEYINDYITNPENNGTYQFDPSQIYENFDFGEHVVKNLYPYASKYANDNKKGLNSSFTLDQSKQLLADDIMSDPIKMRQANDDYESAKDKLGAKTPVEYIQNKYAKKLEINGRDTPSEWMVNGNKDKETVTSEFTKTGDNDWEMTLDYVKPPDNPYQTIVFGGKPVNVKPQKVVNKNGNLYVKVTTQKEGEGDAAVQPKTLDIPFDGGGSSLLHDKFGIDNVYKIANGENPGHMKIKRYDLSKKKDEAPAKTVERKTKDGKVAIFDEKTKEFIRYK